MKVLHIITGLNTGGAEITLYKLLSRMNRDHFEPVVISLMDQGVLGESITALDIPIYCLGLQPNQFSIISIYKLRDFIKKINPDLIQGWMYHGNLVSILARFFTNKKIPIFWNIRQSLYSLAYEKKPTAIIVKLGVFFSGFTQKIIYNSKVGKIHHEKLGYNTSKSIVIPNGFDPKQFQPSIEAYQEVRQELNLRQDVLIIGLIGRYHPMKDHANFLQAAHLLLEYHLNLEVCFVLCGLGVDENNASLNKLITELELSNNVYLLGERQDIPRLNASFDIATSSSYTEAFPNVVGEAMACGVPCTVTDVGDSAWIVGDTGKVVPPKNPKVLAQAWYDLIKMGKENRQRLGAAARSRIIENFSLNSVVLAYENLYKMLHR